MFKHIKPYSRFILLESAKQYSSSFLEGLEKNVTHLLSNIKNDDDCVKVTEELKEFIDQNKKEHIIPNLSEPEFIVSMLEILKPWKETCAKSLAAHEIKDSYDDLDDFETSNITDLDLEDLGSIDINMEDDPFEA